MYRMSIKKDLLLKLENISIENILEISSGQDDRVYMHRLYIRSSKNTI